MKSAHIFVRLSAFGTYIKHLILQNIPYFVCFWGTPSPLPVQTLFKYGPLPLCTFMMFVNVTTSFVLRVFLP